MFFPSVLLLCALPLAHAVAVQYPHDARDDHDHSHEASGSLPSSWYHEEDHPVYSLFRRAPGDGNDYPAVGTPQWSAGFPPAQGPPDPARLPAEWVAALNASVAAGKIPNIPRSTNTPQTNPVYPTGVNPNSPDVCSATYKCRIPEDVWDAPDGVFASSFDDGPLPPTPTLVDFLGSHNLKTTHFMIGVNILSYPSQFLAAFNADNDIAVHTWSHPYMTTLSNLDILGQLGWTMQLIHNSTGGRVPKFWRPPYGDSDRRVSAIAKEVFGLTTVIWNQDTTDWSSPNTDQIQASMARFLASPKSPGLMILEHEMSPITVGGFMNSFPMIASNGWNFSSLARVIGDGHVYQNALSSSSNDVEDSDILAGNATTSSAPPSSTLPGSTSASASSSASQTAQNLQPNPTTSQSAALALRHDLAGFPALLSLVAVALMSALVLL